MEQSTFSKETLNAHTEILHQKRNIIEAALPFIAQAGWTLDALEEGALKVGQDRLTVWRLFPEGIKDAVTTYSQWIDDLMSEKVSALPLENMKVREKIFWAVRLRLECLSPHQGAAKKTALFLSKPQNFPLGARLLFETVDRMWILAGDTSTDYNFYTKRALLAGVYGSTLLFWFQDSSLDFGKTWAFLQGRIENVMIIQKIRPVCTQKIKKGKDIVCAFFKVLRP